MRQDIEFNGTIASDLKLLIKEEISVPSPKQKYEEYEISGKDGDMIVSGGHYDDIQITIPFNYAEYDEWGSIYRNAKRWLNAKGSQKLKLSRMDNYFYKVKRAEIGNEKRSVSHAGSFEAVFACDPYTYLESGLMELSAGELYNANELSHPNYMITGNGSCTLTVNGKTMKATVGQNLTIDTDRMIAYRVDGTMMNTSVTGDYEDLYLQPGENTVSITNGFDVKIIPNWRCL